MPDNGRKAFGDIAPALAQYTDDVLFGDVWERPGLKPRDRSIVTVACLIALYRTNELPFHLKKALEKGLSPVSLPFTPGYEGVPLARSFVQHASRYYVPAA